jgi:hypothetical protein
MDPDRPYASHHGRAIDPNWFNVDYGGWRKAILLQHTNNALVAGKRVTASAFNGSKAQLRIALLGV